MASEASAVSAGNRARSTVAELEHCLDLSYQSKDLQPIFQIPEVGEAIGRISFALQYEKSKGASPQQAEVTLRIFLRSQCHQEAFAKASTDIAAALQTEGSSAWYLLTDSFSCAAEPGR